MQLLLKCHLTKYKKERENNMVKKYIKPEIELQSIVSDKNISSLGDWLEQNNVHEEVSIVTYSFEAMS